MWKARLDIATTSLEDERDMAKGLDGSGTVVCVPGEGVRVEERLWMWRVPSHEAEMRSEVEGE